jgi:nucleoside-diphosphate-sugar epimerase
MESPPRDSHADSDAPEPGTEKRLTVAVTGPTGEIGRSVVRALERARDVGKIIGMARRPFDPAKHGWKKAEYMQGDVLDRSSVAGLVSGADVVVHLAFIIFGGREETRSVNLEGSRNVFEAATAAGVTRLVYTSSVAAYGFHDDNPDVLTEEIEPRGTEEFYYSAQKAELEGLLSEITGRSSTGTYVFRPCIVAGPDAPMLIDNLMMKTGIGDRLDRVRHVLGAVPFVKPVLPDTGVPFQLVHHDDVATAVRAAVLGRGSPGVYNLAGDGTLTTGDLARELGWYTVPVPKQAVGVAGGVVAKTPLMPARASWLTAFRQPVLMDTSKARGELGWRPKYDSRETLRAMVSAFRRRQR